MLSADASGMQVPLKLVGVMSESQRPSKKLKFCQQVQTSRSALNLAHCIGHCNGSKAGGKSNICESENIKELLSTRSLGNCTLKDLKSCSKSLLSLKITLLSASVTTIDNCVTQSYEENMC